MQQKKQRLGQQKNFLILTLLLGLVFFGLQVHSWTVLAGQGIFFVNPNASQSFIYIFTGLHLAHIIAGLIVLIRCLMGAMKPIPHADNLFRMDLASIFLAFSRSFMDLYICFLTFESIIVKNEYNNCIAIR